MQPSNQPFRNPKKLSWWQQRQTVNFEEMFLWPGRSFAPGATVTQKRLVQRVWTLKKQSLTFRRTFHSWKGKKFRLWTTRHRPRWVWRQLRWESTWHFALFCRWVDRGFEMQLRWPVTRSRTRTVWPWDGTRLERQNLGETTNFWPGRSKVEQLPSRVELMQMPSSTRGRI